MMMTFERILPRLVARYPLVASVGIVVAFVVGLFLGVLVPDQSVPRDERVNLLVSNSLAPALIPSLKGNAVARSDAHWTEWERSLIEAFIERYPKIVSGIDEPLFEVSFAADGSDSAKVTCWPVLGRTLSQERIAGGSFTAIYAPDSIADDPWQLIVRFPGLYVLRESGSRDGWSRIAFPPELVTRQTPHDLSVTGGHAPGELHK